MNTTKGTYSIQSDSDKDGELFDVLRLTHLHENGRPRQHDVVATCRDEGDAQLIERLLSLNEKYHLKNFEELMRIADSVCRGGRTGLAEAIADLSYALTSITRKNKTT